MIAAILARLLPAGLLPFLSRILDHKVTMANTEVERQRVEAARQNAIRAEAAGVVRAGMEHKLFWIPWLLAAVPTTLWYGWGVADSMLWHGSILPDVAALPPQLKEYADVVFGNIFYAGAGMAGIQALARAIR